MRKFLATTDYAVESFAMAEIQTAIEKNAFQIQKLGRFQNWQQRLYFETDAPLTLLLALRSIHSLIELKGIFKLETPTLEAFVAALESVEVPEMQQVSSFRATCERYGNHDFTSVEMQRWAGGVWIRKYQKSVDLEGYDINLRADLIGKDVFVGIQHNRTDLALRPHLQRAFHHRAALKHSLAYLLLSLAEPQKGQTILDATCGGGTILMEGYDAFNQKLGYDITFLGCELIADFAQKARENMQANNFPIEIIEGDAKELNQYFAPNQIDSIVSNLPYGVVSGKESQMRGLYDRFLTSAHDILKDKGKIVVLTMRAAIMRETLFRLRLYKISQELITESGGLLLHIFVLEKI
ncbi:methyltransferase domain-containing protein [Hugenholtzia roseola]|uniref:methyltransferase domain-containing protein n=1 Tax=Hugenholtzia roseola TaxID=1002 RepID=UPI000403BA2F|nr:methyltransferase domain-containing protein [Hugenholtzia roseola]